MNNSSERRLNEFIKLISRAERRVVAKHSASKKPNRGEFLFRQKNQQLQHIEPTSDSNCAVFGEDTRVRSFDQLKKWVSSYDLQPLPFVSPGQRCVAKLQEIERATRYNPDFSAIRAALICDLFSKLANHPEYRFVMGGFKQELLSLIYMNYDKSKKLYDINDLMKLTLHSHELENIVTHSDNSDFGKDNKKSNIKTARIFSNLLMEARRSDQDLVTKAVSETNAYIRKACFRAWSGISTASKSQIKFAKQIRGQKMSAAKVFRAWKQFVLQSQLATFRAEVANERRLNLINEHKFSIEREKYDEKILESERLIQELTGNMHQLSLENANDGNVEIIREINVSWVRSIADNFASVLEEKIATVQTFRAKRIFDPTVMIRKLSQLQKRESSIKLDVKLLLNIAEIESFSAESIVLNWMNFILMSSKSDFKAVNNFSHDISNGTVYKSVIEYLSEGQQTPEIQISSNDTAIEIVKCLGALAMNDDNLLNPVNVANGDSDLNFCMFSRLFCNFPSIELSPEHDSFQQVLALLETTLSRAQKLTRSRKMRDVNLCSRFAKEVNDALNYADNVLRTFHSNHTKWIEVMLQVQSYAQQFAVSRMRMIPAVVYDPYHLTIMEQLSNIDTQTLAPLIKNEDAIEDECLSLQSICKKYKKELYAIFQHYAFRNYKLNSLTEGEDHAEIVSRMRVFEFVQFLQDYKFQNSEQKFTVGDMKTIFEQSQQEIDNDDEIMIISEWIEALIRISNRMFPKLQSVSERFLHLVQTHIVDVEPVSDPFRDALSQDDIRELLHEVNPILYRIFHMCMQQTYLSRQTNKRRASAKRTRSVVMAMKLKACEAATLALILRNIGVNNSLITPQFMTEIANKVKNSSSTLRKKVYLVYEEFVQVIVALSQYLYPSPFLTLKEKIENLVKNDIQTKRIHDDTNML